MNFEKKLSVSLHTIKDQVETGETLMAIASLDRLSRVAGRLGRNNEAIHCGTSLHSEQTIQEAHDENRIILGSSLPLHEILLTKADEEVVETTYFDRYKSMNKRQIETITKFQSDLFLVDDEDRDDFRSLENFICGLYDGYFYRTYLNQGIIELRAKGYKSLSNRLDYIVQDTDQYPMVDKSEK